MSPLAAILAGMGRHDPKYSNEQRAAIARAMNERGLSAGEAVKAAAEGLDGLTPFTMPESTARDAASAARREPAQPPGARDDRLRDFRERGFALIDQEMTRIQKDASENGLQNPDVTRLTKLARFAKVLEDLHVAPPAPPPQPGGERQARVIEDLPAALEARNANGNGAHEDDGPA